MEAEGLVLPLDVNFPEPILEGMAEWMPEVELRPLRLIDGRLTELDDRDLALALRQEGYDWLITNNYKMLRNPHELAAIMHAHLHVFAIEATGHDPVRATGALLLDLLPAIARATAGKSEIFFSRPRSPDPNDPWEHFTKAAVNRHEEPADLYARVRVTDEEAARPWTDALD